MLRDRPLANEKHPNDIPNTIVASKHTSIFTENEAFRFVLPIVVSRWAKRKMSLCSRCLRGKIRILENISQ